MTITPVQANLTALVFYVTANTLPFHLFTDIPFWDRLRFMRNG